MNFFYNIISYIILYIFRHFNYTVQNYENLIKKKKNCFHIFAYFIHLVLWAPENSKNINGRFATQYGLCVNASYYSLVCYLLIIKHVSNRAFLLNLPKYV